MYATSLTVFLLASVPAQTRAMPDSAVAMALAKAAYERQQATAKIETLPPTKAVPVVSAVDAARDKAKAEGKHLVIFVAAPVQETKNTITIRVDSYEGSTLPRIVIYANKGDGFYRWGRNNIWAASPDSDPALAIQELQTYWRQQEGVSRSAPPFENQSGRQTADDNGPWLSVREYEKLMAIWPNGVPKPKKLYDLPRAGQSVADLYTPAFERGITGFGMSRPFNKARMGEVSLEFPYAMSGGMDFAEKDTWRSVKGMSLPEKKRISVWVQHKPVRNSGGFFQNEGALFWAFPPSEPNDEMQVFDILLRKRPDGEEHIFTVRIRTKDSNGRWDEGASYFPDVEVGEQQVEYIENFGPKTSRRLLNVFGLKRATFKYVEAAKPIPEKPNFKKSTVAVTDNGHFFPPGFKGTPMTCSQCHGIGSNRRIIEGRGEEAAYGGPELGIRDTVVSWYPVTVQSFGRLVPELDRRWPLEVSPGIYDINGNLTTNGNAGSR